MIADVSIVIPSYKSEKLIGRTLKSLLKSKIIPENIFVVEDGVFDNTEKIIKSFYGVRHIQLKTNKGAPNARNEGLHCVKTRFVMFIDSDDYVSEDLIEGLVNSAIQKDTDIAFGPWRLAGSKMGNGPIQYPTQSSAEEWVTRWLTTEFVPSCSVMWSTDFVKSIGGWDVSLKQNQDGEIAIRGLMHTKNLSYSKQGYSVYWQHATPHRVSTAPIESRLYAAHVIFNQVAPWVKKQGLDEQAKMRLGAFCIKQYWDSIESGGTNKNDAEIWRERALNLGYKKLGYDTKTNFFASVFGIKLSLLLRSQIHRPLINKRKR
ncbi:MAG TPA: glycosyltransferase family 2 protein [Erysipelothrix sp.]